MCPTFLDIGSYVFSIETFLVHESSLRNILPNQQLLDFNLLSFLTSF